MICLSGRTVWRVESGKWREREEREKRRPRIVTPHTLTHLTHLTHRTPHTAHRTEVQVRQGTEVSANRCNDPGTLAFCSARVHRFIADTTRTFPHACFTRMHAPRPLPTYARTLQAYASRNAHVRACLPEKNPVP